MWGLLYSFLHFKAIFCWFWLNHMWKVVQHFSKHWVVFHLLCHFLVGLLNFSWFLRSYLWVLWLLFFTWCTHSVKVKLWQSDSYNCASSPWLSPAFWGNFKESIVKIFTTFSKTTELLFLLIFVIFFFAFSKNNCFLFMYLFFLNGLNNTFIFTNLNGYLWLRIRWLWTCFRIFLRVFFLLSWV